MRGILILPLKRRRIFRTVMWKYYGGVHIARHIKYLSAYMWD